MPLALGTRVLCRFYGGEQVYLLKVQLRECPLPSPEMSLRVASVLAELL